MIKTDECGFRFHDSLPGNYKPIKSIWAFVNIDRDEFDYYKSKIGMEYLIQSQDESRYYIHKLSKYITDSDLIKYINSAQLFYLPSRLTS